MGIYTLHGFYSAEPLPVRRSYRLAMRRRSGPPDGFNAVRVRSRPWPPALRYIDALCDSGQDRPSLVGIEAAPTTTLLYALHTTSTRSGSKRL
jgi:hypothetical protein